MEHPVTLADNLWLIYRDMAPYIMLGLCFAGLLRAFVKRSLISRFLGGQTDGYGFRSVFYATLIGIPLPVCSCGVIPMAAALKKEGASPGAAAAFLIATPQTSVDSVIATYGILGPLFGTVRVIAAVLTGIFGGLFMQRVTGKADATIRESEATSTDDPMPEGILSRLKIIYSYGFSQMLTSLSLPLFFGILAAGVMQAYMPSDFFVQLGVNPLLEMVLAALVGIPLYICSTAAIPVAAMLMLKGLSPGAAFVLLTAGPVTNIAALFLIRSIFGQRQLIVFLMIIFISSLFFGELINLAAPHFSISILTDINCHDHSVVTVQGVLTLLFSIPFAIALFKRVKTLLFRPKPSCCGAHS